MATNNPAINSNKIAFIDTHAQNWQILWQEIQDRVGANQVEAILLDAGRDGLAQMAEALAGRRDIDAIHLLTHDSIITGTSGDDTLSGTSSADTIYGLDGQDALNGLAGHDYLDGGSGADTMTGGLGDDTFVVDDPGDIVVEKSGEGTDTILSSISFNLAVSGAHIDNIVLTGSANIDATGNNLFNQLTGNSGDNRLDGGSDMDIMAGGDGDDTYIVDTSFDIVTEGVAAGNDTIQATFSYTLAANGNVENLDLSSAPSWASPTGTGNGLANHITGNAGNNTLNGGDGDDTLDGGSGADTLNGGTGSDTFVVDNLYDKVKENTGEGTADTVLSSLSGWLYTLPAEVENLTLTGTGNIEGAGNGLDNVLIGNSGNNRLVGADGDDLLDGGVGADVLAGGFGNDVYVVDNPGDQVLGENALAGAATDINGVPASLGANGSSDNPGISANGNLVVFDSNADNLLGVGADTNNARDIFLKNMQTGAVTLISIGANGEGADAYSLHAAITPDGRFVAFQSNAHNLVAGGDANPNYSDIYLRDTWNNTTTLVSSGVNGQANGYSELGSSYETAGRALSDNGQFVVFTSAANNLVAGDNNGKLDVFVKDAVNGTIALASVSKTGVMGSQGSTDATISADGRYVLFSSSSNTLVPGDANSATDIFRKDMQTGDVRIVSARQDGIQSAIGVGASDMSADGRFVVFNIKASEFGVTGNYEQAFLKDMVTGQLTLVSTAADGITQANGYCRSATVSNDGRYVAFETNADNLAPGESNGSTDVYVKDVLSGAICRLSLGLDASQHNSESVNPLFSPDGKFLVFESGGTWNGGGIYRVANPFTNGSEGGIDEVRADFDYSLANYVENLTLTGNGNIDGTGNMLDNVIAGNGGDNVIDGGLGADTASYATATVGVTVSLAVSGAQNTFGAGVDTLVNIERLKGGNFGDTLTAANGGSQLLGGDGDDILLSGDGDDWLDGGTGRDTASYANATGAVTVSLAISGAQATGSAGIDTLVNIENLTGSAFGDQLTGNGGDNILDGGAGADILTGGKGGDLYVVDNPGDGVVETGADNYTDTVVAAISYTLGDNLEALYLSGVANISGSGNGLHNTLIGNVGDNVLDGGAGYDFLDGAAGADTLKGGAGNDNFAVDNVGDVVVENFNEGIDTVNSLVDFSLAANIENLNLAGNANLKGFGNGLDNAMNGNIGNNQLDGGDGNDWLFGREGADTMNGGKGDDNYALDNVGDGVTEHTDEGIDTVLASITYTLAANVEKLVLTGAANIDGTGNTLANTLTGNAGNNKLDGGTDADALIGWAGDDSYGVDDSGDTVTEKAGEGYDTVQSSISYSLGGNVEALILVGAANLNGAGNTLANTLTGNAGNNRLNGGADADVLIGGAGDDSYVVDNVGDTVTEKAGEGYDTVQSSISYSLGVNIEKLILTGIANLDGIGNTLANTLTGNAGNNKLTGDAGNDSLNGGAGADNLIGGIGNDSYMVDNAGDVVAEASGQGSDTVQSAISYTLGANVENLSLIGKYSVNGIGNNGVGNALGNTLTGNQAKNALNGGAGNDTLDGGLGSDTLTGGAGNDIFRFDSSLGGKNIDKIQDFLSIGSPQIEGSAPIHDGLYLDDTIFTMIGATGQFGSNDDRFWASAAGVAHDASDRIIYDSDGGALLYDADGNGAGLAIKFVTLTGHPSLVAEDIWVV